ncbi:hypothetical protein DFH05DRAFT_1520023 [Lentinula detonsa]|uniref:FAD-binding domain-containing protein n=1 Tax=Lentinula detonsa TaxID=2804962 RepID=A0A9W8P7B7_9AGAR|nr:hypothetical protein DFH05DRAFT_1520023 [Lentinula detonsa]
MHSFSGRKLRVAIVGGGIGGLTCAAALKDCDNIELDLFEAAAKFIAIGAGIVTWPRTWSIFEALGLNEEMLERIKRMDPCEEDATPTNLHRQQLLDLLLEHLPFHCQVHFGHRLVSCREYEDRRGCGVELHFRNGVTLDGYDLVIGADGLKSVVRQTVIAQSRSWTGLDASVKDLEFSPNMTKEEHCHLGRRHDILYTGQSAFRGLVPREKLAALYPDHRALRTSTIYCGKSKHVVVYPISNGEIVNVVAFFSDSQSGSPVILETTGSSSPQNKQVPTDAVVNMYPGWEDEVVDLLKVQLQMLEKPTIWPILDLNPLETYATSRIALLGDASHSMSPHLGAGACTAIEDAYILGSLISRSKLNTIIDIKRVLAVYNTLRQPYGNEIMRWAREMGEFYEFDSQDIQVDEIVDSLVNEATEEQMSKFRKGTEKYWSWPVRAAGTIGEDLRRGQEMLNEAKLGAL